MALKELVKENRILLNKLIKNMEDEPKVDVPVETPVENLEVPTEKPAEPQL